MQRSHSSAPHGLGCKREVLSLAREQPNCVNWDQHPQILLPMVCNKAGFGLRFRLPTISSLRGPVCFYSRQSGGLSIMNVLVSSGRDKNN